MKDNKQYIYPLKKGWKERTWYLVEVAFSEHNPVFGALFYSGFLNGGEFDYKTEGYKTQEPGGYNHFAGASLDGHETINDIYYMKVIKELINENEIELKKTVLPNERIKDLC